VPSACPNCRRLTANRGPKRLSTPRSIKRSATVDCPYQVGSQADSAGSIPSPAPITNCVAAEPYSGIPVLCKTHILVLAWATSGHTYPHLGTPPSASEDAQLVASCYPAVRLSGSSNVARASLRKHEGRVNGLSHRSHARAGALGTEVPVRLTILTRDPGAEDWEAQSPHERIHIPHVVWPCRSLWCLSIGSRSRLPRILRGQGVVVTAHMGSQRRTCEGVRAVEQLVD
jgi:hypothetical protein